jgi:hypothetical protein
MRGKIARRQHAARKSHETPQRVLPSPARSGMHSMCHHHLRPEKGSELSRLEQSLCPDLSPLWGTVTPTLWGVPQRAEAQRSGPKTPGLRLVREGGLMKVSFHRPLREMRCRFSLLSLVLDHVGKTEDSPESGSVELIPAPSPSPEPSDWNCSMCT